MSEETKNLKGPKVIIVKTRKVKGTPLKCAVHQIIRDLDEKEYSKKNLEKDNEVKKSNEDSNIDDVIADIISDIIETIEEAIAEENSKKDSEGTDKVNTDEKGNSSEDNKSNVENAVPVEEKISSLDDTVALMNSVDYKTRFKAEYYQTKIRYDKLHNMITSYEAGTLSFEPTCSIDLLKQQASAMGQYLHVLEVRAKVEDIEL